MTRLALALLVAFVATVLPSAATAKKPPPKKPSHLDYAVFSVVGVLHLEWKVRDGRAAGSNGDASMNFTSKNVLGGGRGGLDLVGLRGGYIGSEVGRATWEEEATLCGENDQGEKECSSVPCPPKHTNENEHGGVSLKVVGANVRVTENLPGVAAACRSVAGIPTEWLDLEDYLLKGGLLTKVVPLKTFLKQSITLELSGMPKIESLLTPEGNGTWTGTYFWAIKIRFIRILV